MDESWAHYHDLELKYEVTERYKLGTLAPKWDKDQKRANKVLTSIFCNAKWILFVDYFQSGKRIKLDYVVIFWISGMM